MSEELTERQKLEAAALKNVCAARYYELVTSIAATADDVLKAIIIGNYPCDCGEHSGEM